MDLDAYSGSLTERIISAMTDAVSSGQLPAGSKLPSIRQFAASHAVSTFTVAEAYDRLVAAGLLQARRGDGFYVAARREQASQARPPQKSADAYWLIDNCFNPADSDSQPGSGWLPPDWHDSDSLARALRQLGRGGAVPTGYGEPNGWLPLRELLAANLGQLATARQILLTQGASQGLLLVVQALLQPGDCVLVDDPGYCNLLAVLQMHGVKVVGVPWTENGPDGAILAELLARHQPKAFFSNPRLHNPTGASYSLATAHQVLALCTRHDCWLVEDDVSAALARDGSQPLLALAGYERVIHIGSVSKTLAPSLRVGYVVARADIIDALLQHKMLNGLTSSLLNEQLAHAMLADSQYRHQRQKLQQRLLAANLAARQQFATLGWQVFGSADASLFVWVRLPDGIDAIRLTEAALAANILLAPGVLFRVQPQDTPWLRCNVAWLDQRVFGFFATYQP